MGRIAIPDLNTFKMLRLEINRYGDDGEPVTTKAGYLQTGIMETENGDIRLLIAYLPMRYAGQAWTFLPENGRSCQNRCIINKEPAMI